MKKINKYINYLLSIFLLLLVFIVPVHAEDEEIPSDAESYTLTYPDGTVVTENENGEPLTYEDVVELLKEENWKEMASGLTSDENGEVILDPQWVDGTIKIVETKVPEGYQFGEETEKVVELIDGETTFVNPKENNTTPDPTDPEPTDPEPTNPEPSPTIPDKKPVPQTSVKDNIGYYGLIGLSSLLVAGWLNKKKKKT